MNRNEFFQALPISRLMLRLTGASLEVCTDDIEDIHVMISGSQADVDALRVVASAEVLTVEQPMTALARTATAPGSWLEIAIRLPRTWKGAVDARTVSGWMNIRALAGTDLSLDTVGGMLMISDVRFLTLSARSVTGSVKLGQVSADKCSLFSTSGHLTAVDSAARELSASTVTGLISLSLGQPFASMTLNSVTGEMRVDMPMDACDAVLRSVSGRIHTCGVSIKEGAPRLCATTVSSDLDLVCTLD